MRSAWIFAAGVVLGILLIIGGVQLAQAFGGGLTRPMSPSDGADDGAPGYGGHDDADDARPQVHGVHGVGVRAGDERSRSSSQHAADHGYP